MTHLAEMEHLDPSIPSGILTIDLAALKANFRLLRRLAAPGQTGAVIKADAYGLGAVRIAPALY